MSNRQIRRGVAKQRPTTKELSERLRQQELVGIQRAVRAMFIVVAYELHRRGWKKQSIEAFVKRLDYTFDSVNKNYTTLSELEQVLREEVGVVLE